MPGPSAWLVRSALVQLLLGFALGAVLLANKGLALAPRLWLLLPAHIDLLLFGFAAQLAMGVAFWLLPRFPAEPRYGRVGLVWVALVALNAGVALQAVSPLMPTPESASLAARTLELVACIAFARHAWPRIKPFLDSR